MKTKVKQKNKSKLTLPCFLEADDYHEFGYVKHMLTKFGVNADYEEIDGDLLEASGYGAVFFVGSRQSSTNRKYFKSLMNDLKKSYKEATGAEYEEYPE